MQPTLLAPEKKSPPWVDTTALVYDPADATKKMRVDVGAVATGTTRVLTMPNADIDLGTTSGTFQPRDSDLTAIAALSPSDDDILQRKSGDWANRTPTQVRSDMGLAETTKPTFAGIVVTPNASSSDIQFSGGQTSVLDVLLRASGLQLRNLVTSGGWARAFLNYTNSADASHIQLGGKGSGATFEYGYIGPAFDNTWQTWYPSGVASITKNLAVGTTTVGSTIDKGIAVANGTAPTTYPTAQMWATSGQMRIANTNGAVLTPAGPIFQTITPVGNIGTGEDDLISRTVAANTLGVNGGRLRFTWSVTFAANANNKTLKCYWNGVAVYSSGALALNAGGCVVEMIVTRTAAATQNIAVRVTSGNTTLPTSEVITTGAATLSGSVVAKLTGEATSNDDISARDLLVEYLPAP